MTNMPLSFLPGVCKVNSSYADSSQGAVLAGREMIGRFTDMDKVRFIASYPEKMKGWAKLNSDDQMLGTPRGMKDWRDNSQNVYAGIGTHKKLYYYSEYSLTPINDITPWRAIETGTLSGPFTTTNGSATVTVADTAHGQQVGDYVMLTAASAVGGLTIAGVYFIETVPTADSYTFTHPSAATSNASGGGTTSYTYYRITLTDPIATVNGSTTVTISHNQHGAQPGDRVTIDAATAVGGLTIDGEYEIITTDTNSYTITAASAATSTASGGGTPTLQYDISIGLEDSAIAYGYGTGTYGGNGYGTTGTTGILLAARTWALDNYGQQLWANPSGGTIYIWDPTRASSRAYPLYGAPDEITFMFITPERFPTALGVNDLPMQLAWPDQTDPTQWESTATNTANEGRTLQKGSYLVGGIAIRDGVSLIFTNTAVYNHTYIGDNNIYSTLVAGTKCGLAGPLAVCTAGDKVYWMTNSDFWEWNGSVITLPSDDIRDYVFTDINLNQQAKFVASSIMSRKEIWFYYCSSASDEIDRYVIFHTDQNCFSIGTLERTCWIDKELYLYPMACDSSGYLYKHEYGVDADGAAMNSYIKFSPIDIAKGQVLQDIFAFIPDFKRVTGAISLYVISQDHPQDTEVESSAYSIGAGEIIADTREGGRLCGYRMVSNAVGGDWRLGLPAVEVQPAGARR